jgi:uncharacterized protein GlcG (DUF336 family)
MNNRTFIETLEGRVLLSGAAPQLSAAQVLSIIQAAAGVSLASQTIVVVDRSGDVLGMYGQDPDGDFGTKYDTVDTVLPDTVSSDDTANIVNALTENTAAKYAVIQATARARTAAFFESTQDAFTSRTARFIIQPNFPGGVDNTEAGPLLGVEFSNALGTDALPPGLTSGIAAGLSGDPGGIPLFLNGQPVGAIGVAGDGSDVAPLQNLVPTASPNTMPAFYSDPTGKFYTGTEEYDLDEAVALAGAKGFMPPSSIEATNIFVNGLRLPFTAEGAATKPQAPTALALTDTGLKAQSTLPARTYFAYMPLIGDATYLNALQANNGGKVVGNLAAAIGAGAKTIAGVNPTTIYTTTTTIKMTNGKPIQLTLTNNNPAAGGYGDDAASGGGFVPQTLDNSYVPSATGALPATPNGNFGFLPGAINDGQQLTPANELQIITAAVSEAESIRGAIRIPFDVPAQVYVAITDTQGNILAVAATPDATNFSFDVAVQKARTAAYFSSPTYAFSSRAVGFLADTTLPPAIENGVEGPLYDLQDSLALPQNQAMFKANDPLGNGITIFPGGVPLYKDGVLVGALGISGDGVDQDDLIDATGAAAFSAALNHVKTDDELSSSQIVADLKTTLTNLTNDDFTFPTISSLILDGFDNPDVPNRDGISINPTTDTIITDILKRLKAKGVDGVNLPFQKFPRNPQV